MTQIKDIIHNLAGRVDSATVKETAYTAADKVFNHQQKAVVVNDERNQACGIVFEKDVIHAFRSKGKDLLKTPITDIMSIDLVAATPNDSIEDALQLMAEKDIHLLPIINDKGTEIKGKSSNTKSGKIYEFEAKRIDGDWLYYD